jgi:hypothetical protein
MAFLTGKTLKSTLSKLYIFHIVDTSDTTDNAAGSSFRSTLQSLFNLFNKTETGITAFAGGGQASATVLTKVNNEVTVIATTLDSVKFEAAVVDDVRNVFNSHATNDMNLYPAVGETFKGLPANAPIVVPAGGSVKAVCFTTGIWTY